MLNKTRLLTPGPTPLPEEVRLVMARDMIHHRKQEFTRVMHEVQEALRTLFGTQQPVMILTSSGTGAMTAAVSNLFDPGDEVLAVVGGKFGERWAEIAGLAKLKVRELAVDWGRAVDPGDVQNVLKKHPGIKGVLVQASETSTGVLHPVRELGEVVKQTDALLVVDGISAVGISPLPMDAWGVDCLLTGSQKGLMLPPGLAMVALSEKAWNRAKNVTPSNFYFNLPGERAKIENGQTMFTPAIGLVLGLRECLRLILETGLDEVYRKQWALTALCRAGVEAMGFEFLAPENYTWGLTSVKLPPGADGSLALKIAAEQYGVFMAGGQGRLKGGIVRIGHMGYVDWSDLLAGLYALNRAYGTAGGYTGSDDYLERAMQAYEAALSEDLPM